LGHALKLDHVSSSYPHLIMEPHVTIGTVTKRYLGSGDKAGAFYTSGAVPSGTISFNISLSRNPSISLTSNVYVPSGDSLEITGNTTIRFGNYKIESTGGDIFIFFDNSQQHVTVMTSGTNKI